MNNTTAYTDKKAAGNAAFYLYMGKRNLYKCMIINVIVYLFINFWSRYYYPAVLEA